MPVPFLFAAAGGSVTGWTGGAPDAGETIVLVHGANGHAGEWEPFAEVLAEGARVIAVDLPAHGGSTAAGFSLDACRAAVLAAMDGLQIARADLVGSSFGGLVALSLAAAQPDRARTVTTVGTSAGGDVALAEAIAAAIDEHGVREFYAESIPQFSYAAGTSPAVLEAAIERACAPGPVVATEIVRAAFGTDAAIIPALLSVPVLVLGGADDLTCPPERVAQLAEQFDTAPLIVSGFDHLPHLSDPTRLAGILRAFWTLPADPRAAVEADA